MPYNQKNDSRDDSIENILASDSEALFNKLINTVSAFMSRLKIYDYINDSLNFPLVVS